MEYFINCNTSSLAPFTTPLDKQKAEHLYRRLGFGASVETINQAVGQTATTLVNSLVNQALSLPELPAPTWANWTRANYPEDDDLRGDMVNSQYVEWRLSYANSILSNNLRDRLSFFWSNHFVTELKTYDAPPFLYEYINCLQRNAIGNFKTFTSEIGLTSAMLYYLDGVYNNGNNPNENYAREIYELFCLGEGNNYTEDDIIETAKALTGYTERGEIGWEPVTFDITTFDPGAKTILGQTGNWGYDDVINILFSERSNEIAGFICTKLYEFFVHPDSSDDAGNAQTIISGMATTFIAGGFELAPVLSQLFQSQHFFDDEAIGVIIKSPFDCYYNLINETNFTYTDTTVAASVNYAGMLSQELFNPVDVAGWQRNRSWVNTNFLIGRWLSTEAFLDEFFNQDQEQFRTLTLDAVGPANSNTSNPEIVVRALVNKFTPKGLLTDQDFENAMSAFKVEDVPENYYGSDYIAGGLGYWNLYDQSAPKQVFLLLRHIVRQPEFQLK
tara:strand:+ start:32602 stop:34107 length:1506 start_codon:yes stop_codon:yes gene_type:complete